jgi:hypothetical protein
MPTAAGRHTFSVRYRQGDFERTHTGTFTARDGKRRGQLRVDPQYPEHFLWAGTGEPHFWHGTTTYYLMGWEDDAVIRRAIDRLAALKVNRLRALVYGRNEDRTWGQPVKSSFGHRCGIGHDRDSFVEGGIGIDARTTGLCQASIACRDRA